MYLIDQTVIIHENKNRHRPVDLINSKQPFGVHGTKHLSKFPCDKSPALRSDNPSISLSGETVLAIRFVSIVCTESNGN